MSLVSMACNTSEEFVVNVLLEYSNVAGNTSEEFVVNVLGEYGQ